MKAEEMATTTISQPTTTTTSSSEPSSAVKTLQTLAPLTAAAISTAVAMYPVDVLRALKMSQAAEANPLTIGQYYSKFGWRGFVQQGVVPEVARASLMRVSKFFFFPIVCENLHGVKPKEASGIQKFTAGAIAVLPEILMVTPIEVAKLGLQLDTQNKYKNNMGTFLKDLRQTRGLGGLYTGWSGLQWRQSFWTGTYFATLKWWQDLFAPLNLDYSVPKPVVKVLSGFMAGAFACLPCAPGDVVRSVIQKRVFMDPKIKAHGVSISGVAEHFRVAGEIISTVGIRGLYSGIPFKALHLGGSGACLAVFVPFFARVMGIQYGGI